MKKIIFIFAVLVGITQFTKAQTLVGGGVFLGTGSTAIEAKADFNIADQISVSPSVDYFLSTVGYSAFQINVDGHYNFESSDKLAFYPLAGLNYYILSGNGFTASSGLGFTVGGGGTYKLSDTMKIYSELKYIRSGVGISAGVLFSL